MHHIALSSFPAGAKNFYIVNDKYDDNCCNHKQSDDCFFTVEEEIADVGKKGI